MKRPTKGWARDGGSVRVGTLLPLADILVGLGVNPAELLAEAGVDPKVFDDPENRLSVTVHNHLVALAVARTGCPHIGLLVGQRDGLQSLGLAGLLVRYSPDVDTALRSFVRYLHTHVRGAKIGAHGGRQCRHAELGDLPAGGRGRRPGGRRRAGRDVQHPARAVRPRVDTDRGALRPSRAGPVAAVSQLLPHHAALRRRGICAALLFVLAAAPGGAGQRGAAAGAAEGAGHHRGRATRPTSRRRCAACCARRCSPGMRGRTGWPRCSRCTAPPWRDI